MEEASGASMTAAPSQLTAARSTAARMEGAGGVTRAAPRPLKPAVHPSASRTKGAGAASTRAAPSRHTSDTQHILPRARGRQTVPAQGLPQGRSNRRHATLPGAWRRQAVPAQEGCTKTVLELQAARSARYACDAHSRSPTMRRRSNPLHTSRHSARVKRGDPAAGEGLRINQFTAEASSGLLIGCRRKHP
jgi:hypothetical protein